MLAGVAIGLPRAAMKSESWPPISRVVPSDDQGQIPPWDHARHRRLVPSPRIDSIQTAGGIVVQTVTVVAATIILAPVDPMQRPAERIAWASRLVLLGYAILDIVFTWRTRRPRGDNSSRWLTSQAGTVATLAVVAAIHIGLVNLVG